MSEFAESSPESEGLAASLAARPPRDVQERGQLLKELASGLARDALIAAPGAAFSAGLEPLERLALAWVSPLGDEHFAVQLPRSLVEIGRRADDAVILVRGQGSRARIVAVNRIAHRRFGAEGRPPLGERPPAAYSHEAALSFQWEGEELHLALLPGRAGADARVMRLEAELALVRARLKQLARTDGITGLPDLVAAEATYQRERERAERAGVGLGLILVDLEGLADAQAKRGREAAEEALRRVASTLRESLRSFDALARTGLDEFLVILPDVRPALLRRVAGRLVQALETLLTEPRIGEADAGADAGAPAPGQSSAAIPVSAATVEVDTGRVDRLEPVMSLARNAIRDAARGGLHGVVVVGGHRASAAAEHVLDAILDDPYALTLRHRPVVALGDRRLVAHEIRVGGPPGRYEHPDRLATLAHGSGRRTALDRVVICQALLALPHLQPAVDVVVHAHPESLAPEAVERLLEALPPADTQRRIHFAFDEAELPLELDGLEAGVARLKAAGHRTMLCGLGGSRAGVDGLVSLQPHLVRFSERRCRSAEETANRHRLRQAARLVRALGGAAIADGISDEGLLDTLVELGFELAQGPHFGPEVPVTMPRPGPESDGPEWIHLPPA